MSQGDQARTGDASVEQCLHLWADELRATANEGLQWAADKPYDLQRYHHVLRIAATMFATQDGRNVATMERAYCDDLGHIAPYPTEDAAIFDQKDRILLIRRKDNGLWAMPSGDFEVGSHRARLQAPARRATRSGTRPTHV